MRKNPHHHISLSPKQENYLYAEILQEKKVRLLVHQKKVERKTLSVDYVIHEICKDPKIYSDLR